MDALTLAMELVPTITVSSILGLFLALFSYFLDFCFWRGNVFSFWLPFVASNIVKRKNPLKYQYISKVSDKKERQGLFINEVGENGLFKVLGGCSICLNVWIGFVTFPFINLLLDISYWYMIVYLLSASFILRKIMKVD
jgi:hypothetical protein